MRTALALLAVLVCGLYCAAGSSQFPEDCKSYSHGAYVSNMCYYIGHKPIKLGSLMQTSYGEPGAEACNQQYGDTGEPAVIWSLEDYEKLASLWRTSQAPSFGLNMRARPNVKHWTWNTGKPRD
jgi:hypothetical protein